MLGFRVWDVKNKHMDYGLVYFYADQEGSVHYDENAGGDKSNRLSLTDESEYIPMQSMGIRSGSEIFPTGRMYDYIYEQDIVEITSTELNVRYSFLVESIPQFYSMLPGKTVKFKIMIHGNSFENPELMEKL